MPDQWLSPNHVIFVACTRAERDESGLVSIYQIFNQLTGIESDAAFSDMGFSVVTAWASGLGEFVQAIVLRDQFGSVLHRSEKAFQMSDTGHTVWLADRVSLLGLPGTYELQLLLGSEVKATQTLRVAPRSSPFA